MSMTHRRSQTAPPALSSPSDEQCRGCASSLPADRQLRGYCSTRCARYNKPLPRVATAYLAEEHPLLFQRDEQAPDKTMAEIPRDESSQDVKRRRRQAHSGWAVVRRAVLTDKALRALRGRGHYFPPGYDPVADAKDDIQQHVVTEGLTPDSSPSRRQSGRESSKSRLTGPQFMAAPDAPPVPFLLPQTFGSRSPANHSEPDMATAMVSLTLGTSTRSKETRTLPSANFRTHAHTDESPRRERIETYSSRISQVARPNARRASSLSAAPPSAQEATQYSDVRPFTLGEDSPVLVPGRCTIDSMLIEKILAGPSRETIARYNNEVVRNSTTSPVSSALESSSHIFTAPKNRASKMKSRTPTRLGVEFRASRWEGSAPRDVWQSVRALREESRDEPDCRDKLLNRATCMGD